MIDRPRILVIHHTASDRPEQEQALDHNHEGRGYDESAYGSHIAYHFLVGKDGTVKQTRPLDERTYHTRNEEVNRQSIAIVLAGNFQHEYMTSEQLDATHALIKKLDGMYQFEKIIPHREASATACPGKNLIFQLAMFWRGDVETTESWRITRYYSPTPNQPRYYHGSYLEDVRINCGLKDDGTAGDCSHTADGYLLTPADTFQIAACPPEIPFGTKFQIDGIGVVTCRDRGGAIKDKRLDVWAGYGTAGLENVLNVKNGGLRAVTKL